jgi:hypothetical protein
MTIAEHEWLRLPASLPSSERRLRLLARAGAAAFAGYVGATIAGAPGAFLSPVFAVLMVPVPLMAWWAYRRAAPSLRRPLRLLASAATLWLLGSLVWQAFYTAAGDVVPHSPGVWDAFFVAARVLVIAALVVAMRSFISFRLAALDAIVIIAAGIALAAPFVRHGLEQGVTASSLFTLNRPLLSIVTLMLIASALLGSWEGVPRSLALVGVAEVPLMVGNLIYSYEAVQGRYVDDRWANLAWGGGAIIVILAASVIVLRIDRPIRLRAGPSIPGYPTGSRPLLLVCLAAFALVLAVALYGLRVGSNGVASVGVIASIAIGAAMALRARQSLRSAEHAYSRLDEALVETERAKDDLAEANEALDRANTEMRAAQVVAAELLYLADHALIAKTGRDLRETLREQRDGG